MAKAPQLERKGLTMAVVKVKAEHLARVLVSARVVRKAPASRRERMAKSRPSQQVTKG